MEVCDIYLNRQTDDVDIDVVAKERPDFGQLALSFANKVKSSDSAAILPWSRTSHWHQTLQFHTHMQEA